MEFKRPSMLTIFIVICVILVIAIIITLIVGISSMKSGEVSSDMDRIDSISGEENVLTDDSGNKMNSSNNTALQKVVDDFIFDSFDISTNNGISTITFEIYNQSEEEKNLGEYELKVIDKDGNIIGRITDNAGTLGALSRREVSLQVKGDIANLSDIQVNKIVYKQI